MHMALLAVAGATDLTRRRQESTAFEQQASALAKFKKQTFDL
jgi:hypothetical protein